jgi:hypothetical protein
VIVWPGFPAFLTSSPPADKQFKHLQEPHHGRSPRFATDLLFDRYQGEVTDHDAFWTVRTPGSPDYYFGNYCCCPPPKRS